MQLRVWLNLDLVELVADLVVVVGGGGGYIQIEREGLLKYIDWEGGYRLKGRSYQSRLRTAVPYVPAHAWS